MNMKKTSNELFEQYKKDKEALFFLLSNILDTLYRINEKIEITAKPLYWATKDKAEIIDEKIKDEVREQQIAEDFKF